MLIKIVMMSVIFMLVLLVPSMMQFSYADSTYTKMDARIQDTGQSLWSTRPIHAEFGGNNSTLYNQEIDSITLKLSRFGSPTGTATIGIFDTGGSLVKQFGTVNVATGLTGSYTEYTFALPSNNTGYLIHPLTYIGIKYTGGDANNYVRVMRDKATSFDGDSNGGGGSFHVYFNNTENKWHIEDAKDMYMKLTNTVTAPNDNCDQITTTTWTWLDTYAFADRTPFNRCIFQIGSNSFTIGVNPFGVNSQITYSGGVLTAYPELPALGIGMNATITTISGTTFTGTVPMAFNIGLLGSVNWNITLPTGGHYQATVNDNRGTSSTIDIYT